MIFFLTKSDASETDGCILVTAGGRAMKPLTIWVWTLLMASVCGIAQGQTDITHDKSELPRLKIVKLEGQQHPELTSIIVPTKCDEEGNVYMRSYGDLKPLNAPLYKFNPAGEKLAIYSLPSDPSFQPKGTGALGFAIGKDGHVFQLAVGEDGYYVLKYNKDGSFDSRIKLQLRFTPSTFQPFDSGEFLITGVGRGTEANPSHAIITAVFANDGAWIKRVELVEDKLFEQAADRGDADFIEPGQNEAGNFAVERGQMGRGSDGNVYVARWTYPAKVYVIAPSGAVVRSFDVTPPLDRRKPDALFLEGDRLALEYSSLRFDSRSFVMVIGREGQEPKAFDFSGLGSNVLCYRAPGRFTLLNRRSFLLAELP